MKRSRPRMSLRHSWREAISLLGALLFAGGALPASLASEPAGESSNRAKNLARPNGGAQIQCITPDGRLSAVPAASEQNKSAPALIMDDATLRCPLQEGETTFIISLPSAGSLDRFTFVNENAGASGKMKIAVSNHQLPAASSKWVEVDGSVSFSRKRLFNLSMVGIEARYVKLSFQVEKEGRSAAAHASVWRWGLEEMPNLDFANLYAKAQVVFVSSGAPAPAGQTMGDDRVTAVRFAAADPQPTAIVELAPRAQLHRVRALNKMRAGHLQIFLMDELRDDPGDLRDLTPAGTLRDNGQGKAAANFDARGARYVALRWIPDRVDGAAANPEAAFELAEIDALGDVPLLLLTCGEALDLYVSKTGFYPGKGSPEASDHLDMFAALPVIPAISP